MAVVSVAIGSNRLPQTGKSQRYWSTVETGEQIGGCKMNPPEMAVLNSLDKRSSLTANACGVNDAEDDKVTSEANEMAEEDGCAGGSEANMSEPLRTSFIAFNTQENSSE
jgi:hypothetical protein